MGSQIELIPTLETFIEPLKGLVDDGLSPGLFKQMEKQLAVILKSPGGQCFCRTFQNLVARLHSETEDPVKFMRAGWRYIREFGVREELRFGLFIIFSGLAASQSTDDGVDWPKEVAKWMSHALGNNKGDPLLITGMKCFFLLVEDELFKCLEDQLKGEIPEDLGPKKGSTKTEKVSPGLRTENAEIDIKVKSEVHDEKKPQLEDELKCESSEAPPVKEELKEETGSASDIKNVDNKEELPSAEAIVDNTQEKATSEEFNKPSEQEVKDTIEDDIKDKDPVAVSDIASGSIKEECDSDKQNEVAKEAEKCDMESKETVENSMTEADTHVEDNGEMASPKEDDTETTQQKETEVGKTEESLVEEVVVKDSEVKDSEGEGGKGDDDVAVEKKEEESPSSAIPEVVNKIDDEDSVDVKEAPKEDSQPHDQEKVDEPTSESQ